MRRLAFLPLLALVCACVSVESTRVAPPPPVAKQAIVPPGTESWRDDLHFSAAVRSGDLVFLAGVVATPNPGETGRAGMEAAIDRTFRNIAATLAASGSSWDDVVDITSFHTDLPGQIEAFSAVKDRYVKAPYPAWTAIDIDRLYVAESIVEVKVVARATRPVP
ncbi:MAG: Rid family hydrolase [Hyphomonadaceae bacterium]|nr:Rid family hydrolase [Hyphomonadaceae bacterium]